MEAITIADEEMSGSNNNKCSNCNNADVGIFQIDGEFCLSCWQERTEPYITTTSSRR